MDVKTFQNLPIAEVARLVRAAGPKVCVFPINGTRRWFMLEHSEKQNEMSTAYLDVVGQRHVELYRLFFDHGVDTLLTPVFGPELISRGEEYMQLAAEALARLATHPDFVDFYHAYQVRIRFYGGHRQLFATTPYAYLSDMFDQVTAQTLNYNRYRLFFGVFSFDPSVTEPVIEPIVHFYSEHGRAPSKRELIELYYGEYVNPVNFFIGFDRFCIFGMPALMTGNEDLYFTTSPSLTMTEQQLRHILYDHLYSRTEDGPDYTGLHSEDWDTMKTFYQINQGKTLGIGLKYGGVWYPLPEVELPDNIRCLGKKYHNVAHTP